MWLFPRARPHEEHELIFPEMLNHSERLHEAIKKSAATNASLLDDTTRKSLDQVQRSQDVILAVKTVIGRMEAGDAFDTVEKAMDLVSRQDHEDDS